MEDFNTIKNTVDNIKNNLDEIKQDTILRGQKLDNILNKVRDIQISFAEKHLENLKLKKELRELKSNTSAME